MQDLSSSLPMQPAAESLKIARDAALPAPNLGVYMRSNNATVDPRLINGLHGSLQNLLSAADRANQQHNDGQPMGQMNARQPMVPNSMPPTSAIPFGPYFPMSTSTQASAMFGSGSSPLMMNPEPNIADACVDVDI